MSNIKPADCFCMICGIEKDAWLDLEGKVTTDCCNRPMVPKLIQVPGFRIDHTWDDELMKR